METFVVRCVLGDLDALAVVEVSVSLILRRRGSQGIGARASESQARRPGSFATPRPAMVCGLGR
jgi:hypothetical protein